MKNVFVLALTLLCATAMWGQQHTLLHNDRVAFRSGPLSFNPEWAPFYHGVASGDPLEDRVIIWTRVTPQGGDVQSVDVGWRVATDVQMENVVQSGSFTTDATRDFTVKIDVAGLEAGQTYYYAFRAYDKSSLIGKTKTVPVGNDVAQLKFGVVSCSNFQAGYFNGYKRLAERTDLDAVIHLGDYIYEYADGVYGDSALFADRVVHPATEIVTLVEYRTRYSTYRMDTALVRVHQQHPFITVWDDHESANDAFVDGAQNHDPATEGDWEDRKAASKQAYFEWLPIRDNDDRSVYRKISYGSLLDLIMLDTRLEGRDEQIASITDPALQDTARTLLGAAQREWFIAQLTGSQARWKVVGQQVIFSELNVGWAALADPSFTFDGLESLFLDIWDGYPAERSAIIDLISEQNIDNVVFLTGDFHSAFAFDVTDAPVALTFQSIPGIGSVPVYAPTSQYDAATGDGSVAVEFVTPSITSANFDENTSLQAALGFQAQINTPIQPFPGISLGNPNPHMKFTDLIQHGYFILDIQPERAQADWYFSPIGAVTDTEAFSGARFTEHQANRLQPVAAASNPKPVQDVPAPNDPPAVIVSTKSVSGSSASFALLANYPNPVSAKSTLHYSLTEKSQVKISLFSKDGKLVRQMQDTQLQPGIFTLVTDTTGLPTGTYVYHIYVDGELYTAQLVKQ